MKVVIIRQANDIPQLKCINVEKIYNDTVKAFRHIGVKEEDIEKAITLTEE